MMYTVVKERRWGIPILDMKCWVDEVPDRLAEGRGEGEEEMVTVFRHTFYQKEVASRQVLHKASSLL